MGNVDMAMEAQPAHLEGEQAEGEQAEGEQAKGEQAKSEQEAHEGQDRGGKPNRKRQRSQYTAAQKELVRKCVLEHGMGYKKILRKYPDWGFNVHGLRTMVERVRARKTTDRKAGSGRPRAKRTPDMVAIARQYMMENEEATCRDLMKKTGLKRTTAQTLIKYDLQLKPRWKVIAKHVKELNKEKRLEMCKKWEKEIASGALDLTKIFWTDEKFFRLGSTSDGNQNLVVSVKSTLNKSELQNDLILRDDGKFQGGASVMVSLGLSHKGKGTLRFAPAATKINTATYLDIVENTYLPDCHQLYGVPPDCVFQHDGASTHTANKVQDYCTEKFPLFWDKRHWPPNSPDLNPLDFFAWGYLQAEVNKKKPKCLDTLKVAIRQAVEEMPLPMVQKAVLAFGMRVKLCIKSDGGVFKHKEFFGSPVDL